MDPQPQTIERAIKRRIDISVRLGALEDEVPPRGRERHRPVRGRDRRNAAMARRPRVNTPAAGSGAAPAPAAESRAVRLTSSSSPAPAADRSALAIASVRDVRSVFFSAGPTMAGSILPAMPNLLDADGAVSPAKAAALAEDPRSGLTR